MCPSPCAQHFVTAVCNITYMSAYFNGKKKFFQGHCSQFGVSKTDILWYDIPMETKKNDLMDESLRRLGGIMKDPSLVLSYGHTTPRSERAWLRRMGLTKTEADAFLELLCRHGLLDRGAEAVVASVCRERRVEGKQALRLLLEGQGWEDTAWDTPV